MMGRQSKAAQELCDRWNKLHPEGSAVTVTKDDGSKLETTTRSEAWVLGGHTAVIMVVGISGGYSLTRVTARRVA
jgi:hypothetical protein